MQQATTLPRHPGLAAAALLAAVVLAGCQSGNALFSGPTQLDITFINAAQTWDLNKDNVVTCEEWKQYLATSFKEVDGNGDGALSRDEFARLAKQDRLFEDADYRFFAPKADDKLTLVEMQERPNPAFKRLDKNADCRLVSDEMVRVHTVGKGPDTDWQDQQEKVRTGR